MTTICRVLDTDTIPEMARKIFYDFEINQSCTIVGFVHVGLEIYSKGELVWREIKRLDEEENFVKCGRRKRILIPGSIGGPLAHKIFKHSQTLKEDEGIKVMRFSIWRVQ